MLTIDARMICASGIGTYLRHLLPHVIEAFSYQGVTLLGRLHELSRFPFTKHDGVRLIECSASIYSLQEQIQLLIRIPRNTHLFWSPHYNIPLLYRGKLLVTIHDVFHLANPQYVAGWHRKAYAKAMFTAVRRRAAMILTVSRFAKDELEKYVPSGEQEIHVIYNGVASSWRKTVHSQRPHQRPYFLYVGNVKPHKNLAGLLDAFERIMDTLPYDLVVIGRHEGFITGDQSVVDKATSLKGRVRFAGELDHNDPLFRAYYSHAEAFVLPSLYETFGLPPLEAMASGCPVILGNVGALPEIFGNSALYMNPRDPSDIAEKLRCIVADRDLRQRLIEEGLARSKQFTWERSAEMVIEIIEPLLKRNRLES